MAHLKASKKDARTSKLKALRNSSRLSIMKTAIKKVIAALTDGKIEEAKQRFVMAQSRIAKAKGKGVVKANTAARIAKRLALKIKTAQN